jgi:hydrogenase maturation protein HypF
MSQHIGDVENVETRQFLMEATNHLIRLTNTHPDTVVCDLHPKFITTNLAAELAEQNGWKILQVQHHHSHVAALMAEHAVEEMVGIACDGYGYGTDGEAWGGEILFCQQENSSFKRLAHLEPQPLIGGDAATRNPLRVAAAIMNKKIDVTHWLTQNSGRFPHGEPETKLVLQQLKKTTGTTKTTSCGRILDAAAAILGVCYERTYEGEPAMKLESAATNGQNTLRILPIISGDTLDTTQMILELFENRNKMPLANLAYSVHAYLAMGLATLAVEKAMENGVKDIGFSGGAACNEILASIMRKTVEEAGFKFYVHQNVPAGDGGVSFGQAVVGAFSKF